MPAELCVYFTQGSYWFNLRVLYDGFILCYNERVSSGDNDWYIVKYQDPFSVMIQTYERNFAWKRLA